MLRLLTVVDSGQGVFHEVTSDHLRSISFEDNCATGLILPVTRRELLRVRPAVASGDLFFLHGVAPLHAVVSRSKAGESMRSIAEDYDVLPEDIEEAPGAVLPQAA